MGWESWSTRGKGTLLVDEWSRTLGCPDSVSRSLLPADAHPCPAGHVSYWGRARGLSGYAMGRDILSRHQEPSCPMQIFQA